ncbi:MAG: Adenine deaminase, partial [Firmicutes bacterium]|nr:Adenine deaminase [Bacillota bacterium]
VKEIQTMQGGIIIVNKGKVLGSLPLPIAGLMAEQDIVWVQETLAKLHKAARGLGVKQDYDPFMTLSFLSLPVIPLLKLTDMGLVDVDSFHFVPVSVQK